MALVAEGGAFLDEPQLLRVAVILVAGGAFAAVGGIVDHRYFGKLVVALEALRFVLRRRPGGKAPAEDKDCGDNKNTGSHYGCHTVVLPRLFSRSQPHIAG